MTPNWWRRRAPPADERLAKELQFHLDERVHDLVQRGYEPMAARRQALIELGGVEQVKENCRDERGLRWLRDATHDVRDVWRLVRHAPAFAAVVLLTLALGTGATTIMFSVVNGVLLQPVPFASPDRLVQVSGQSQSWNTSLYGNQNVACPDFRDLQRESRTLDIGGYLWDTSTMSAPGEAEHLAHLSVSANLFGVLGVHLDQGREFTPDEDRPGGSPVALLSESTWRRKFGGSSEALGTTLVLDGRTYTIVGIVPDRFQLDEMVGVYTPLGQDTAPFLQRRAPHPIRTLARLRTGATMAGARSELTAIGARLAAQYPDTNKDRTFTADALRPEVGDVGPMLWLLFGAVSLVLLVACTNVASLLLARAIARDRELALRVALGAGRARLIRQCLVESAALGMAGGILGVAIAWIGLEPFVLLWPGSLPRASSVQLDWQVLAVSLAVSIICGLLVGIAPALRAPVTDIEPVLRAGSRTLHGGSRRLHTGLVVAEIALAMVLLSGAGALGRTLLRAASLDPGLDVHHVLTARTAIAPAALRDPARARVAWADVLDNVRRVPGVTAVAMVDTVPMRAGNNQIGYRLSGTAVPENQQPVTLATCVTPDYFTVVGIPLRRGRLLSVADRMGSQPVAVIDEVMAQQAFNGREAIGGQLWIGLDNDPVTVVGVVGHVRHWGLAGDDQSQVRAQVYYLFDQLPDRLVRRWSQLMSLAVRTSPAVDSATIIAPLRRAIRGESNDQVLYEARTLESLASASIAPQRFLLVLFGVFAALAVGLAAIGIYGVLAYVTNQRLPEMAVRMALGASASRVVWIVLRQSLVIVIAGTMIGLVIAFGTQRVLNRLVEGMQPAGLAAMTITVTILIVAGLLASAVPARRAGRVDPSTALKS